MTTRTIRLSRLSATACATVITSVSAWAFVNSTASIERDPFQFGSTMAANAKARAARFAMSSRRLPEVARDYRLPDLSAPPPACLGSCA
jgi:hypothetical protein